MSLKKVSKRMAATTLAAVMAVTMNLSAVSAQIQLPKTVDDAFTIDVEPGEPPNEGTLTQSNYISQIGVDTTIAAPYPKMIPVVWGPAVTGTNTWKQYTEPVGDGVDLTVPTDVGNATLRDWGILDVTAAPFNATVNDTTDDTAAIQKAIEYGKYYQMAVYLPAGTYIVSDTIHLSSGISMRTGNPMTLIAQKNEMPTVLIGSKTGTTTIKLKAQASGFGDPTNPKAVLHYYQPEIGPRDKNDNPDKITVEWGKEHAADREGNIMIDSITVDTNSNPGSETNPNDGAIGIVMSSAQGGVLQDVTVDATSSLVGIVGGSGNGGSWTNVTVTGGKFGIDSRSKTITVPSMQNITLQGQTEVPWLAGAGGTTVVAGMKIMAPSGKPAIVRTTKSQPFFGSLNLIDTSIEYPSAYNGPAIVTTATNGNLVDSAIGTPSDPSVPPAQPKYTEAIYLNNFYVKNAARVLTNNEGTNGIPLNANTGGWFHITEYATGKTDTWNSLDWNSKVYISKTDQGYTHVGASDNAAPLSTLQSKHGWTAADFPSFQMANIADYSVKNPIYAGGAKGNGNADDTAAIQAAINASDYVFLPKGYYRIKGTLQLKPNTKIFGVSPAFTTIYTRPEDIPAWTAVQAVAPLVRTANDANANTVISDISITPPREIANTRADKTNTDPLPHPLYSLKWQAGGGSKMRAVQIEPIRTHGFLGGTKANLEKFQMVPGKFIHPLMLITGSGGGKIYNVYAQLFGEKANATNPALSTLDESTMRLLAIRDKDASNGLSLYATNFEYLKSDVQVEVLNSHYVTFYGSKTEENTTYMHIKDSNHIRIFGHSGSGSAPYDGQKTKFAPSSPIEEAKKGYLFHVENTTNFLITSLADQVHVGDPKWVFENQVVKNPYNYYYALVVDLHKVPSLNRPSMYKIGNPAGSPP